MNPKTTVHPLTKPIATATSGGCAALLALACLLGAPASAHAAAEAVYEKDETVYATLEHNGSVESLYVVNQFDVLSAGIIKDAGAYDRITNLSDTDPITTADDVQTIEADEGVFYYQGDIVNGNLPWDFDITYALDDRKVDATKLAGKDGRVEIRLDSSVNENVDEQFPENYLLQVSFTVPADSCHNIDVGDGTIVDAGADRHITYTIMPGQDADLSFRADAENFEMSAITVTGTPVAADANGKETPPISFMSSDNDDNIERVQFSLTTRAIEVPDPDPVVDEEPKQGFIDRVRALFGV